jgi:hypothetical protein
MKVVAKGRDEVLKYLEEDARKHTGGKDGEYMLVNFRTFGLSDLDVR